MFHFIPIGITISDVRAGDPIEECPTVWVKERAVSVERAILDGDGDLVVILVWRELVALFGGRTRQHRRHAGAVVQHGLIACRPFARDVEAGGSSVDVEACHTQRMVVIPERGRAVVIRVLESGIARAPGRSIACCCLAGKELIPGAFGGVAHRSITGGRQVPCLGVAVALVAHAHRAVHMGDDGHGASVWFGSLGEGWARVAPCYAAGRVGPVQRRINGQQMGQVIAVCILQLVDPLDPYRPPGLRFDGK